MKDEDDRDPVEELAEGFLDSVRRGENPTVEDYAQIPEGIIELRADLLARAKRLPEALADYDRLVLLRRQRSEDGSSPDGAHELERALQARAEVERLIQQGAPAKE